MSSAEPCELLDWDTRHFGFRVAQIRADSLTPELVRHVKAWCREQAIVCLYLLAKADDVFTGRIAAAEGFVLADVRVTFARSIDTPADPEKKPPPGIRASRAGDLDALRRIAAVSFHDSRFYYDRHFPRRRCDELYATWVENAFHAAGDAVLVAEHEGHPTGFITCQTAADSIGHIGLVAVDAAAQGRGLGRALVVAAMQWFRRHGFGQVLVRTQARNHRAGQLYRACGFAPQSRHCWYHRWFEPCRTDICPPLPRCDTPCTFSPAAHVTP